MDISHGGGEFTDALRREVEEKYRNKHPKRLDFRTRRDRVQRRVEGFEKQMDNMVSTYIEWVGEGEAAPFREGEEGGHLIRVVDLLGWLGTNGPSENYNLEAVLDAGGKGIAAALIKQGLCPCAPYDPSVVITARTLEFFRVSHARCPRLSIQTFVKSICDLHGLRLTYKLRSHIDPTSASNFRFLLTFTSRFVEKTRYRVLATLGRLGKEWRLKHVCPCCTYHLVDDPEMIFSMLATFAGNESLRRVARKVMNPDGSVDVEDDTGEPLPQKTKERTDTRDAGEGYFIDRQAVDKWAKKKLANLLPTDGSPGESVPCADRWKNMINNITSKMWGIFDETGIFLALCRHGFVLLLADMIRSGELAKYPLAMIDELLDAYAKRFGLGYDVGCHLEETIKKSDLSKKAKKNMLKMLVSAFHGHAHNRLCQLKFLATYVHGLGLKDLEGCERFFSKSNEMAKVVRYSSRFHRQQEITGFIKHFDDFETYANLSKFLCKNYEQALALLATEASLKLLMRREGIESVDEFDRWLVEEKEWLESKKEQVAKQVVTMEMDCVQKLVNLSTSDKLNHLKLAARRARREDSEYDPTKTTAQERGLRHAREVRDRDMDAVMELEDRLGAKDRWTTTTPKWIAALKHMKFMEALNALEVLIVQRIFELTKVNQSETGYKMRKHIAKALQTRSEAVKNAINRYNIAALAMEPPSPSLTWDEVVEYVFLADFEFLRATDGELNEKPWTRPAYCPRSEEIVRLNVEVRRLVTWISDEDEFLRGKEVEARESARTVGYGAHEAHLGSGKDARVHRVDRSGVSKEKRERIRQERRERRARVDASEMDVDVSEMDVDVSEEEPVTIDMAAGWQADPGLEEGWVNVEESAVKEGIEEDIEGQQQEVSEWHVMPASGTRSGSGIGGRGKAGAPTLAVTMGTRGGAGRRMMALWVIQGHLFTPDLLVIFSWILEHVRPRRASGGGRDERARRAGTARDGALVTL
ncbi:hypothetical protein C8F04DRAFT_1177279 [Mycena alexandri]|uniref:Uncharacterized protein n=1 Tax=Mycena alexandri TaxID=1745969 RepID=A0AAD6T8F9_9AGAR|nr:hypothetical protein C8F04DRAFT_1177279 [Mycena alexandri]